MAGQPISVAGKRARCSHQFPDAVACNLTAMAVTLEEIRDQNREAVLALRVAPGRSGS
jgi:hypothetical protein